jgi:hypothetical protein
VLLGVLLAAFGAGIWGSYRATFPAPGLYRVSGVFESRAGDLLIVVRHEAVPGLMGEMSSMVFNVESRGLLERARLERGDRIRLTLRQAAAELVVVDIEKLC